MAACIAEFKAENPGEWVIGILSSAGVDGDQALINTLNAGGTTDVTWVVGGHDHDPFFQNKESFCLAGTGTGAAFMCKCAICPFALSSLRAPPVVWSTHFQAPCS